MPNGPTCRNGSPAGTDRRRADRADRPASPGSERLALRRCEHGFVDVGARDVPAGREPGLIQRQRPPGIGDDLVSGTERSGVCSSAGYRRGGRGRRHGRRSARLLRSRWPSSPGTPWPARAPAGCARARTRNAGCSSSTAARPTPPGGARWPSAATGSRPVATTSAHTDRPRACPRPFPEGLVRHDPTRHPVRHRDNAWVGVYGAAGPPARSRDRRYRPGPLFNGVDAAFMSYQQHDRGIHALCPGTGGARATEVCPLVGGLPRRMLTCPTQRGCQPAIIGELPRTVAGTAPRSGPSPLSRPDPRSRWGRGCGPAAPRRPTR